MGRLFIIMTNFLVMILLFGYGINMINLDTYSGKPGQNLISENVIKLGLEVPRWTTVVASSTITTDMPLDVIWTKWMHLEKWNEWSKSHKSARFMNTDRWEVGTKFQQTMNLGFPYGKMTFNETVSEFIPKKKVVWCKDAEFRYCVTWLFESSGNLTTITNTEVYDGVGYALLKPIIYKRWQKNVEQRLLGLTTEQKE